MKQLIVEMEDYAQEKNVPIIEKKSIAANSLPLNWYMKQLIICITRNITIVITCAIFSFNKKM